jgi:hypothetical protein
MSDSEVSNGGNGAERSSKAPSTILKNSKGLLRTCGLCDEAGTDVDARFYSEWFHFRCTAGIRSKTRLMTPAQKAADKRRFVNDKPAWKDRFGILGIIVFFSWYVCLFWAATRCDACEIWGFVRCDVICLEFHYFNYVVHMKPPFPCQRM